MHEMYKLEIKECKKLQSNTVNNLHFSILQNS